MAIIRFIRSSLGWLYFILVMPFLMAWASYRGLTSGYRFLRSPDARAAIETLKAQKRAERDRERRNE